MTLFLLEGDNDPHLPKLSRHAIASFSPARILDCGKYDYISRT